MRPPGERGPERQVRVVQAGERTVAREAHVGLYTAEGAAYERRPQRLPGGVRAVSAPAAVRDEWQLHLDPLPQHHALRRVKRR